jgi:Mitochondrial carrier protein
VLRNPADVVKTRLMTQSAGGVGRYNGVLDALGRIAREDDVGALGHGFAPRIAAKMIQSARFFATDEASRPPLEDCPSLI